MRLWLAVLLSLCVLCASVHGSAAGAVAARAGWPDCRAAGTLHCHRASQSFRVSQSDRHTLLYGTGRTIWANHLGSGCGFNSSLTLVTQPIGSSHCRGDLVRSFDSFTRIPGPSCVLGEFTPYTHQ